jgi:hypothetical protein
LTGRHHMSKQQKDFDTSTGPADCVDRSLKYVEKNTRFRHVRSIGARLAGNP